MMKILITGATGFIGSILVRYLLKEYSKDLNLYCLTRSENISKEDSINWITQDLSKKIDYSNLPDELDVIIHMAQSRHYREFPKMASDIFNVNTGSTLQLLDYGREIGLKSFIFASSGGVYRRKNGPFLEGDSLEPPTFYLKSKYMSECLIDSYSDFFSTVILRYFFVYGEGQRNMLVPNLISSVRESKPIIIYNKVGIRISPIHIDDAIRATVNAMSIRGNEVINVAGADVTSILELSELIGEFLGKEPVYEYREDPNVMDFVANIEKMKSKLGVIPITSINEGVKRTISEIINKITYLK